MERGGKRFIIDLYTQMVGEEATSSDSEGEGKSDDEGKKRMELDKGVLRLGGSNDDDLDSVNGLFQWQMEDYKLFPSCNMLRVDEKGEENECPKEYKEVDETNAITAEAKGNKRKDSIVRYTVNGPHGNKRLHRTTKLVERCRQQGKHIIRSAQEIKRKGLMKTSVAQSVRSKIKTTIIDGKEWQPTKFMVRNMENLREGSFFLNKLDERRLQAQWATEVTQNRRKPWHDKHLKLNKFQPGQLVLKYGG